MIVLRLKAGIVFIAMMGMLNADLAGQSVNKDDPGEYRNSIEIGPMGDIYMLQYARRLHSPAEIVIGGGYLNTAILNMIKYPGINRVAFLGAGYRRYLWRNLNIEYQLFSTYVNCIDTIEQKVYKGPGLTTELRMGYRFEFRIRKVPLFVHLQWFAGYAIINPRPPGFIEVDGGNFYISPIPIILLGGRF